MKNLLKRFGFAGMLLGMLTLAPLTASAQNYNMSRNVDRNVYAQSMLRRAPARNVDTRQVNARSTNRGWNDRDDRGANVNSRGANVNSRGTNVNNRQDVRRIAPIFRDRR